MHNNKIFCTHELFFSIKFVFTKISNSFVIYQQFLGSPTLKRDSRVSTLIPTSSKNYFQMNKQMKGIQNLSSYKCFYLFIEMLLTAENSPQHNKHIELLTGYRKFCYFL